VLVQLIIFIGGISTGALLSTLAQGFFHFLRKRSEARSASLQAAGQSSPSARWWQAQWIHACLRWSALVTAPILSNGLYASFAIARTTLQRVDPVVFAALQLSLLLPVAVVVLCCTLRSTTKESVRLGLVGGLPLGGGFVCIAISLRDIGVVPTAMLTALDGIMASLIAWLAFRERLSLYTCLAVACAGIGACFLWWVAPSHWQTDLVALACGLLFTLYVFHVERNTIVRGAIRQRIFPFFGGVFLAMAAVALALALCFGRWETLQAATDADLSVVLYCALGTVLIPLVITTFLLRYISTVTWAFLAVLEPLLSLVFAYLLGSISLGFVGWCGVSSILLSMFLQANAGRPRAMKRTAPDAPEPGPTTSVHSSAAG
jgi:drug/metabolite transporter (DMT)-like permease